MTIFDPYSQDQPQVPGMNTGTSARMTTVTEIDGARRQELRSGLLTAVGAFIGWMAVLVPGVLLFGAAAFYALCTESALDAATCQVDYRPLAGLPVGALVLASVLAGMGRRRLRRLRTFSGVVLLGLAAVVLVLTASWFTSTTGLSLL